MPATVPWAAGTTTAIIFGAAGVDHRRAGRPRDVLSGECSRTEPDLRSRARASTTVLRESPDSAQISEIVSARPSASWADSISSGTGFGARAEATAIVYHNLAKQLRLNDVIYIH